MNRRAGRPIPIVLSVLALLVVIGGCTQDEDDSDTSYKPATLSEADASGLKTVTFTADGARRVHVTLAPVVAEGSRVNVPYAALIYDKKGGSWVYGAAEPLVFKRVKVEVDRIVDDRALLSTGPTPGTQVVTTGAAEVWGAELDIAGKH